MRVLVTGAGGQLGGVVVRHFAARPDVELIASGRRKPAFEGGVAIDLTGADATLRGLTEARPDVVVHAAGRAAGTPAELTADNAVATANLAEAMATATPDAGLVLLSSAARYGDLGADRPWREDDAGAAPSPYGAAKRAGELSALAVAARTGLRVTPLRLFNVAAPQGIGEQALPTFLRRAAEAIAAGPPPWRVMMAPLGAVRDFITADDVARAVAAVIDRGAWGAPINVCSGVGRPVRDLVEAVSARLDDVRAEELGHAAGVRWAVGDPARCEARLGFRPSLDVDALADAAAAWVRETGRAHARSRA